MWETVTVVLIVAAAVAAGGYFVSRSLSGKGGCCGCNSDRGPEDSFMSYALPWANVSNAPFRRFKQWTHEGGISTPMVLSAPRRVAAGGVSHETLHIIDLLPTCLQLAGVPYPRHREGRPVPALPGESFTALLDGQSWTRERPLFWEHEGNCAVRAGDWKLVSEHTGGWELYNMRDDRTELRDLAARDPARVADLTAQWQRWADEVGVLPWDQVRRQ